MVGAECGRRVRGGQEDVEVERRELRVVARSAEETEERGRGGGVRGGERRERARRRKVGDGEREDGQGGVERNGCRDGGGFSEFRCFDLRGDEALMPGDQRGQLPREAAGGSHRRNRKGKRSAVTTIGEEEGSEIQ